MHPITADTQRLLRRPVSPIRFRGPAPAQTSFSPALASRSSVLSRGSGRTYSTQPPRGPNQSVKFWPFIAIIVLGSAGYYYMVKQRAQYMTGHAPVRRMSPSVTGNP
ncbi:hypothetical protein F5B20DRAFT_577527 [Whalleya microplaca]|nr:hypothetical protein F5B20DRAFT_577527 [Whalleya microplaca]